MGIFEGRSVCTTENVMNLSLKSVDRTVPYGDMRYSTAVGATPTGTATPIRHSRAPSFLPPQHVEVAWPDLSRQWSFLSRPVGGRKQIMVSAVSGEVVEWLPSRRPACHMWKKVWPKTIAWYKLVKCNEASRRR